VTIVGLPTTRAALKVALAPLVADPGAIRAVDDWVWVALPMDTRRGIVDRLAAALDRELVVIEVEMSPGGRGRDITATRYLVPPRGEVKDLSEEAREILHEWAADMEGGIDEDRAISEVAWELLDDTSAPVDERPECFEDRWADALVTRLVHGGGLELRGTLMPNGEIAHHLQNSDGEGFAALLLDVFVNSTAVAEVYVDEEQLAQALLGTRPK
jgi:hypothetical protein